MFTPGDYVVYSIEGVCRVEEAGRLNVPGLERVSRRITAAA